MKNKIKNLIEKSLLKLNIESDVEIIKAKTNGDFASNIALKLSGKLKKNPLEIANLIKENIEENEIIEKIEIANPGFMNFFLSNNVVKDILNKIIKEGSDFGKGSSNKKINIEMVSANPTGYLHIGHARNAVIGDTLFNILKFAGNDVNKEYWLNDSGVQIEILAKAVFLRYQELQGKTIKMPEDTYKGSDIIDCAKYLINKKFNDKYKDKDFEEVKTFFANESIEYMVQQIKKDLKDIGVSIDEYTSERKIINEGFVQKSIKKLDKYIYEKDSALWIKTTLKGDDKDRVITKKDGKYTYFAPDIAGHEYKLSRGFDQIIDIFGKDHIGYGPRIKAAVELLGLPSEKFQILFMEMVSLLKDGKPLKMSKRAGVSLTIKDMLEILTKDEIRYFLISRSVNSQIELDIDKIKAKDNDNPLFNIKYSYARAYNLIKKSNSIYDVDDDFSEKEKELISHLNYFPKIIKEINIDNKIHKLPKYLLNLSRMFNSFYSNVKIIGSNRESSLLSIVKSFEIVVKNGLSLLSIEAPKKV